MSGSGTGLVRYRGGVLVSGDGRREADLLVEGGQVVGLAGWEEVVGGVSSEICLEGATVLPGLVDAHVHFGLQVGGGRCSQGISEGSLLCLAGGVTTVADFASPPESGETLLSCLKRRIAEYEGQSAVDYVFHLTLPGSGAWDEEVARLACQQSHRFKLFTTYRQRGLMSTPRDVKSVMDAVGGTGSSVWVHCESDELVERATGLCRASGRCGAEALPDMRPAEAEEEAIRVILDAQGRSGCTLHVVHISTRAGADMIRAARDRGASVTGETCPHYLVWDRTQHSEPDGYLWTMAPPLRTQENVLGLWQALSFGWLQMVTTDSCGFPDKWKAAGRQDVATIPMGIQSAGMILPVLWTLGVETGRLGLERLVELTSEGPARGLGLYPRKGTLRSGSDADFVVLARGGERGDDAGTVSPLYAGRRWQGWPRMVVKGGVQVGVPQQVDRCGRGRYLGQEFRE